MNPKNITDIKGSVELLKYLQSFSTRQELDALFASNEINNLQWLSMIDTDSEIPMAHLLAASERFVMSELAQNPAVLDIKDNLGYPLSFRLMRHNAPRSVFQRINTGEDYIQELINKGDDRVSLLKTNAIQGEVRKELLGSPHRLWLLTDAAKDLAIIDKPFRCLKDPHVWKFFGEQDDTKILISPMEAIIASSYAARTTRPLLNLIYHKKPELLTKLEAYAEKDSFSNSYPGFESSSPGKYSSNALTLVLLAKHYQESHAQSLADVDSISGLLASSTGYDGDFNFAIGRYFQSSVDRHNNFIDQCKSGELTGSEQASKKADQMLRELAAFEKNLAIFASMATPDDIYYYRLEWLGELINAYSARVDELVWKYKSISEPTPNEEPVATLTR